MGEEEEVVVERVVAFASSRGTSRPACHNHGMCAGFVACTCKRRVFATFEQEATEEIAKVLAWRKDATSQAGLVVDVVVLPFTLQKQLQARHYQHWVEGPQNAEDFSRCKRGTSDTMSAHLVDRYRSWCIDTLGGVEWLYVLIALGDRDNLATKCIQEALQRKEPQQTAGCRSRQVPLPPGRQELDARKASEASAASRGELRTATAESRASPASPAGASGADMLVTC